MKQLSGEARTNPFQADLELNLLASNRSKLMKKWTDAIAKGQPNKVQALSKRCKRYSNKNE